MSKRPRRNRKGEKSAEQLGLDTLPPNVVTSPAFEAFEARIAADLELLVERWGRVAAPLSLNVRRMLPLPNQRPTEPA